MMRKSKALNGCILLCAGCATHYDVSLRYRSQEPAKATELLQQGGMFCACIFTDTRENNANQQRLGRRVTADGEELPINSIALLPGYALAAAIKTYLFSRSCSVYGGLPGWDLQQESIDSQWGRFAIGGSIQEFEARAWEDMGWTRYRTQITLRVVAADVHTKHIIYTTIVEASSSLQNLHFSETIMEREINKTLSSAVEKFFGNQAQYDALQQSQQVRSSPLHG